jgi:phage-related protein
MNEELKIIISAEVDKLWQRVEKAKQTVKSLQDKFKEAKKTIKEDLAAAGESASNVATKMGAGLAAIGAALVGAAASTQEYREQQALLVTAFQAAGASAETAKETFNGLYRVMGDSDAATEAAQSLARLTNNQKSLNEYVTIAEGIWGSYGKGMPIETLAEAVAETAAAGTVTGDLSRALVEAGVSEDAFNEKLAACNTEAEREKLIRETLLGLYSEAAATYEKNNAQILKQRDEQAKLQETLAKLGAALAPVITAFTSLANEALAAITPHISQLAEKYMPKLEEVLKKVGEAIGTVVKWIVDNWDLISTIATVVLSIVAAFTALNVAMKAVAAVTAIFSMNPIVLAIGAVIAVIALCITHWDDIKEAAKKAWEGIKKAWEKAGDWFKGIWKGIQGAFSNVGSWFSDTFTRARQGVEKAWSGTKTFFSKSWENIKTAFAKTKEWFSDTFTKAWNGIKAAFANPQEFFSGVLNKIKGAISSVDSWMGEKFGAAWETVKAKFAGVGTFFTNVWNTIKNIFSKVGTAIADGIKGAVTSAVNRVLSTATKIINGFISAINFAIDIINAIPGVNIKRLEKLNVPQMAKGGVVDSATLAVIGERGKEAVMPLENNLEWLDKLAGMLNDRMGGSQPIVMNVDGKRFAEISVESINNLTRQRGSIPLVIA